MSGQVNEVGRGELSQRVEIGREQMRDSLASGVRGVESCRRFSYIYDELVRELWERALKEEPALDSGSQTALALVATGGWGRREVCPYSDIDFLLLAEPGHTDKARAMADRLLYPLWDAKIKVGHAVRTAQDAAALAKGDLPTATSLLDARLVVGNQAQFERLQLATRDAIAPGGNCNAFVQDLFSERQRRYERFGDSLYLLEPNIKQGIGGLRDYATAHWAAKGRWSVAELSGLLPVGEITRRQAQVMERGRDYLLELRCRLQLEARRSTDQLSFELQEAIAPALFPDAQTPPGDVRPAVAPAVERLMRRYYLAGRGIERVTDRVLESARIPERRKPRIHNIDGSFLLWNGKLAVRDPMVFRRRPEEMFRYFRVAREYDVPLYGHTTELIEAEVARQGHVFVTPRCAEYFLDALTDIYDSGDKSLLREMHSVGLLAAVMPEFGPCTGRIQHDLYHVYTVDHHQIYAVSLLKKTARGELGEGGEVAMRAYKEIKNKRTLYLALLLHDVGKPWGAGHADKGADISANIARGLGMSKQEQNKVEFLVRNHLIMSHVSQRRDLADPGVIENFAASVGDAETLGQLYLLTRCDTAMTAPGNLTSWKDQLLSELYIRTRDHFLGVPMETEQALHRIQARQWTVEHLSGQGQDAGRVERADELVERLDPSFINSLTAQQLRRVVELALTRVDTKDVIVCGIEEDEERGQNEFIVVALESPALLSHVAGVLTAHRVTIDSATICTIETRDEPLSLQVFRVRDEDGPMIDGTARRWERIQRDLRIVVGSDQPFGEVEMILGKRAKGYDVVAPNITTREDTHIKIFDSASSDYSVIEVVTGDRIGLLHLMTKVLAGAGLDIHRSLIGTDGDRVVDTFYVQRWEDGSKIPEAQATKIQTLLAAALESPEETT